MRRTSMLGLAIFSLSMSWSVPTHAAEPALHSNWPRFRGPEGTGHSAETELPSKWDAKRITFRLPLPGIGQSSPVVWDNLIFLTAALDKGNKRAVLAVDRNKGKIAWQRDFQTGDPGPTHAMNQHASASCTTDGQLVYSFFGKGGFYCHDVKGKLIWQRDDLGEFLSIWGTAASPVLYENTVILCCDQDTQLEKDPVLDGPSKAYLIAMDKATGKTVWTTPRLASRGWGTPVFLTLSDGSLQLVLNGPGGVFAYDPKTGKELWHCDRDTLFGEPAVVFYQDLIFAQAGRPGPMLAIRQGGTGNVTASHLAWRADRRGRDMASPIVANDLLFTCNMQGIAICYDPMTGKQLWTNRLSGEVTASPIFADGRLYYLDRKGTTTVLLPKSEYTEVARNPLPTESAEDFLASPAVSDGQIFLRSDRALYAIGKRR